MYQFRKQIEMELIRLNNLQKKIGEIEIGDAEGTLRERGRKENKTYALEKSIIKNGTKEKTWIDLGKGISKEVACFCQAKYLRRLNCILDKNIAILEKLEKAYIPYGFNDVIEGTSSAVKKVLLSTEIQLLKPHQAPINKKNSIEYKKVHRTVTGVRVRSKNEAIVFNLLHSHGLNPIYEYPLELQSEMGFKETIYPDFCIIDREGKVIIVEHLGLLENPEYRENFLKKFALYISNGYSLWDNLFFTMDGPMGIDTWTIDKMIKDFILPQVK